SSRGFDEKLAQPGIRRIRGASGVPVHRLNEQWCVPFGKFENRQFVASLGSLGQRSWEDCAQISTFDEAGQHFEPGDLHHGLDTDAFDREQVVAGSRRPVTESGPNLWKSAEVGQTDGISSEEAMSVIDDRDELIGAQSPAL